MGVCQNVSPSLNASSRLVFILIRADNRMIVTIHVDVMHNSPL